MSYTLYITSSAGILSETVNLLYLPKVENLAYHHNTWLNDKRHLWKDWKYGRASLAVDGDADATLHRCAILDNYFVDNPVWMVDLGKKSNINGVVIVTWQGKGQGIQRSSSFRFNGIVDPILSYLAKLLQLRSSVVVEPESFAPPMLFHYL